MEKFYKKFIVLILSLLAFSCAAQTTVQDSEAVPECMRTMCENPMAKTLTETAADADFATGLVYPVTGDVGPGWWDSLEAGIQQAADRQQAFRLLNGISTSNTRPFKVPLIAVNAADTVNWTEVLSSNKIYWQHAGGSGGAVRFRAPPLPVGAKITSVEAWFQSGGATVLPATQASFIFYKQALVLGTDPWGGSPGVTSLGTATGSAASAAAYSVVHKITLSGLADVILDSTTYHIAFSGDTNDASSGTGVLWAIDIIVSLP